VRTTVMHINSMVSAKGRAMREDTLLGLLGKMERLVTLRSEGPMLSPRDVLAGGKISSYVEEACRGEMGEKRKKT